jgi:heat shock protein HslJ
MNTFARLSICILGLAALACNVAPGASPTPTPTPSPTPSSSPSPSPSAPPVGLDDRTFLSVAVTDDGAPRPLVADTRIRLSFDGNNLGASAGCNQMGFTYSLDGDRIVASGGAMTEMGCDPARHAQDDWLSSLLGAGPTYQLAGHDLVLTSDGVVITLLDEEAANPDRELTGTTWLLTTIFSGGADGAAVSIPEGVVATLLFNDDGTVDVQPGCNQGGGTYSVEADTITFGDIALTRMACQNAQGQVEADVLTVLGAGSVQYSIDAGSLTLETPDGGLQFTAQ